MRSPARRSASRSGGGGAHRSASELASVPLLAVSSAGGPAGVIILFTVAAYRRWQLALLVAGLQLAPLPVGRTVHPQGDSLQAYYLTGTLGTAAIAREMHDVLAHRTTPGISSTG